MSNYEGRLDRQWGLSISVPTKWRSLTREGMGQVNFALDRFTLKHDTADNTLFSQKVGLFGNLPPLQRCQRGVSVAVFTCTTSGGDAFSFNTSVLSFVRTGVNASWPNDGAYSLGGNFISYGTCEFF